MTTMLMILRRSFASPLLPLLLHSTALPVLVDAARKKRTGNFFLIFLRSSLPSMRRMTEYRYSCSAAEKGRSSARTAAPLPFFACAGFCFFRDDSEQKRRRDSREVRRKHTPQETRTRTRSLSISLSCSLSLSPFFFSLYQPTTTTTTTTMNSTGPPRQEEEEQEEEEKKRAQYEQQTLFVLKRELESLPSSSSSSSNNRKVRKSHL